MRSWVSCATALGTAKVPFICFALWRVRRAIQRKPDLDPPHMLADAIRHSVFLAGFKVKPVNNPALEAIAPKQV